MNDYIIINDNDNVAVALIPFSKGEVIHGVTLLDDVTTVRVLSQEETNKRNQQIEEFEDDIIDCLSDAGIKHGSYSLSNEWPHFYVDFDYREDDAIAAYNALSDCLFKCDLVDDDGFYYVHILRR